MWAEKWTTMQEASGLLSILNARCWFNYSRSLNDAIGNQIGLHWVICPIAVVY